MVYNRICNALQSLITEAQSALVRKSSLTPPLLDRESIHHRHHHPRTRLRLGQQSLLPHHSSDGTATGAVQGLFMNKADAHRLEAFNSPSSSLNPRRSSWTQHSRMDRPPTVPPPHWTSSPSHHSARISTRHTNRKFFSRMIWKEKQQEQYERYRRSCDMISYELQTLLDDSLMDSDVGEAAEELLMTTAPSVVKPALLFGTWSLDRTGLRLTRFGASDDRDKKIVTAAPSLSKTEQVQRKYQAQVLGSQVRARRRRREEIEFSTSSSSSLSPSYTLEPSTRDRCTTESHRRHFRSQGVGPSPSSDNILVQLYRLWKQSWLRTRIMHVLTGSLEMMLILWVVFKLSEISLRWMGLPNRLLTETMNQGPQEWLASIYGYRHSAGASAAKELYKRIRQEGLTQRGRRILRERESETLLLDHIKAETAPGMPTRRFSPAGMVWGPAGNALAHIVSGVVLAYLSDRAKGLSKRL